MDRGGLRATGSPRLLFRKNTRERGVYELTTFRAGGFVNEVRARGPPFPVNLEGLWMSMSDRCGIGQLVSPSLNLPGTLRLVLPVGWTKLFRKSRDKS